MASNHVNEGHACGTLIVLQCKCWVSTTINPLPDSHSASQIATTSPTYLPPPQPNSGSHNQAFYWIFLLIRSIHSSCDSRNLNLSPLCNLSLTSLAMWQPSVLETYGNLTTDYVAKITGPLRPKYPNSMGHRELITSLTKV